MSPAGKNIHPSPAPLQLVLSEPTASPRPILVFPHLPGTGADTLTAALLDSMPGGRRRLLPAPAPGASDSALRAWHSDAWMALSEGAQDSVVLAAGPTAAYLAAALGEGADTIALLREPLAALLTEHGARLPKRRALEALGHEAGDPKSERLRSWSNPQSRALLRPWHDTERMQVTAGPPEDADHWRELLFGDVLSRVETAIDPVAVARTLAVRLGSPPKRAVREATALVQSSPVVRTVANATSILSLAWLDAELYDRCLGLRPV